MEHETVRVSGRSCGLPLVVSVWRGQDGSLVCPRCGLAEASESLIVAHIFAEHPGMVKGASS